MVSREEIEHEAGVGTELCAPGSHKHIVDVPHHGWLPGLAASMYYIDMELCEQTLEQCLQAHPVEIGHGDEIWWQRRFSICTDIASGLAYIHLHDTVHRDLKPRNGQHLSSADCSHR